MYISVCVIYYTLSPSRPLPGQKEGDGFLYCIQCGINKEVENKYLDILMPPLYSGQHCASFIELQLIKSQNRSQRWLSQRRKSKNKRQMTKRLKKSITVTTLKLENGTGVVW